MNIYYKQTTFPYSIHGRMNIFKYLNVVSLAIFMFYIIYLMKLISDEWVS